MSQKILGKLIMRRLLELEYEEFVSLSKSLWYIFVFIVVFDYFNTEMHQCNEFVRLKLKLMQFFHSSSKVRNLRRILWVARIYAFTHASNSGRVNHDKDKVEVLHKE